MIADRFIVCGLGTLGQYCAINLKKFAFGEFHIHITAIDRVQPDVWEIDDLPAQLAGLVVGDCRKHEVLLQAGIESCRAALFVTSDESLNIEAAITARRLNPNVCLVVRSSRHNLNQLLHQQLGNFVALNPLDLPAAAFAVAGIGEGTLGFFKIGDRKLRVIEKIVQHGDYRFDNFPAYILHKKDYRLLCLPNVAVATSSSPDAVKSFYQWQPDTLVKQGDRIIYIEEIEQLVSEAKKQTQTSRRKSQRFWYLDHWAEDIRDGKWKQKITQFWQWLQEQQTRKVVSVGLFTGLILWSMGAILLKSNVPEINWQKAMSVGMILLLGGYGDVFGGLTDDLVPWWVQFICLMITVISLLFVLGVLGLVADNLISSKFNFLVQRPSVPSENHVVLVGMGRVGQGIASLLQEFKQPVVGMTEKIDQPSLIPHLPLISGNFIYELSKVNLQSAKSVIVATEDQMLNLEVALMAKDASQKQKREINLVIRTQTQGFSESLLGMLPNAKALCPYELSAAAFAGAAFGENILGLFRLSFNNRTILVAEYKIEKGDQLAGKNLSQVAYGYGVVPVFYQKHTQMLIGEPTEFMMPMDDKLLTDGDRLVILSSIDGLRRIERRDISTPQLWRLAAEQPLCSTLTLGAGNTLANIAGCSLRDARAFIDRLPSQIDLPLYPHQAYRLQQELSKHLHSLSLSLI